MNELTKKVIAITIEDLGPAAERLVLRQIRSHLKKDPADLTVADLPELAKWIELSAGMLINVETGKAMADRVRTMR
ncbi:hypothetical protein JKY72_00410 [Candidatus Gracilibacteria bacterium]|nr:hypothetical protein [Candidatus Gracilibacteria bacterium]